MTNYFEFPFFSLDIDENTFYNKYKKEIVDRYSNL